MSTNHNTSPGLALLAEIASYVDHATATEERDGKARGVCACGWRGTWSRCASFTTAENEGHLRNTAKAAS